VVADEPKKSDDNKPPKRRPEKPSAVEEIRTSLQSMQDSGALDRMRRVFSAGPASLKGVMEGSEPSSEKAVSEATKAGERPGTKTLDYIALGLLLAPPAVVVDMYLKSTPIDWRKTAIAAIACWIAGGTAVWASHVWQSWNPRNWRALPYLLAFENKFWGKAIIVAASIGFAFALSSVLSTGIPPESISPTAIIHDPSSAEDIAKATAPIQAQLNTVTQQRDAALSDAAALRRQLEATAPQPTLPTAQQPSFANNYDIPEADIRNLRDEIFKIRNFLPSHIDIRTADDAGARRVANALSKGLGFGGISTAGMTVGYPITPQETGISIRYSPSEAIPDGAKKLAEAIKKVTGAEPKYTPDRDVRPEIFFLFVGTNPKDN
jgi:hypothetical protein